MRFHERLDAPTDRLQDYYQPIAEFTRCEWTLDCVDCHTRLEAMGDGHVYSSKKDIQYVRCKTAMAPLIHYPSHTRSPMKTTSPYSKPSSTRLWI